MNDGLTQTSVGVGARREIVIAHRDQTALMRLTVALARNGFSVTAIESTDPLQAADAAIRNRPAAIVVALDASEDIDDIAGLSESTTDTKVLFLAPGTPSEGLLARLVRSQRVTAVSSDDASAVIVAALIALLAQKAVSA